MIKTKKYFLVYFAMILTDKLKQPVVAKFLSVINMGHIHTQYIFCNTHLKMSC